LRSRFSTGAITKADTPVPTINMTCCFHGVAPTSQPVLRSCRLSPAMAAAHATTAPMRMAAAAPFPPASPNTTRRRSEANRRVAMVTPETGLLDEPTSPVM
jgi:hypothetical protein